MDEAEWLTAVAPHSMLAAVRGPVSGRKQHLLVCACARRLWRRLPDPRALGLLAAAERHADGEISRDDLARAYHAAGGWAFCESGFDQLEYLRFVLCRRLEGRPETLWKGTRDALSFMHNFAAALGDRARLHPAERGVILPLPWDEEARAQADLLREIVGNPFRPSPPLPDAVRRWQDDLVPRLARSIYDERRWADLPLLADALLDAGCEDDVLMDHCRDGGEHALGCWAVDVILGRG